jgi:hypothetical protein
VSSPVVARAAIVPSFNRLAADSLRLSLNRMVTDAFHPSLRRLATVVDDVRPSLTPGRLD